MLKNLRTLKGLLLAEKRHYLFGALMLLVCDALQLTVPLIMGRAYDHLALGSATRMHLLGWAVLIVAVALAVAVLRFLWRIQIIPTAGRIEEALRNKLFRHLTLLSPNYYASAKTGDLMAHATNDLGAVREACRFGAITIIDTFFICTATLILMFFIHVTLTLYVLVPLLLISLVVAKFNRALKRNFELIQESFANLTEKARENFSGIRVVKSYVQEEAQVGKFQEFSRDFFEKNMSYIRLRRTFDPLLMVLVNGAAATTLYLGGVDTILSEITIGSFIAFWWYMMHLTTPMIGLGLVIPFFQRAEVAMGRINKILAIEPEIADVPGAIEKPAVQGKIEFRNLTYTYPGASRLALRDVSLTIEPGATVAVVGRIGSGKTTLVNFISRMLEPPPGRIFVDDTDITKIKLRSLRTQIAFVPQNTFLFAASVRENIAFSDSGMELAKAQEAAKIAQIHDQILSFPHGYDTIVGERGVMLSGGEKQRVAIARAIAADPKILVLDDCLSAVDTHTEEMILQGMQGVLMKRTSVMISHRISSIQRADFIIVLDDGRIAERGTHSELLALNGTYAEMYHNQQLEEETGPELQEAQEA